MEWDGAGDPLDREWGLPLPAHQHWGNPWQIAWTTPVVKGQWYRFTWHFDLSASGWVELYVNDVQEPLLDGKTQVMRLPIAMLDASDSQGPWYSQEQVYYQHGAYPSATLDFKNYAVATTRPLPSRETGDRGPRPRAGSLDGDG